MDQKVEELKAQTATGMERLHANVTAAIEDMKDAFLATDYEKAQTLLNEVATKLNILRWTELNVASVGAGTLLRVRDVQVGMYLQNFGRITSREEIDEPCESGRHRHQFVKLGINDDPDDFRLLPPEGEVVMVPDPETAESAA